MTERDWVGAFPIDELPVGQSKLYRGHGCQIAVFRLDEDRLHAVDNRCPHEGYPLNKGWVKDGVVTCPWHNFKFDLRDGHCLMGDEAVRTFPLRLRGDQVELDVTPPDPAVEVPRLWASLEQAMLERKLGQMARDVVRLIDCGVTRERIALEAARLDAVYAELGTTHALPVAVDVLRVAHRYPEHQAVLPLLQPFDLASESHLRRPRRPLPEPAALDGAPVGERLAELVEAERGDDAVALLRGAIAAGRAPAAIESWLFRLAAEHFLDFGHALIYVVKMSELLARVGWEHADALLPALVSRIVNGTREDLLPEWAWFRRIAEEVAPRAQAIVEREQRDEELPDLFVVLADGDREEGLRAVVAALEQGASDQAVVDAISAAAAERMIRFDVAIDADATVQEGWLDVTHTLTFAAALRVALRRWRHPGALRLILFAARFVLNTRPLDLPPERRLSIAPRALGPEPVAAIVGAIGARRAEEAVALTAGYLASGEPLDLLRVALEDLALGDGLTRPIVVGHAIKTCVAAFDEHAAIRGSLRSRPILAAVRLLASPIQERRVGRAAHEAIRFVVHGKVPRTLT